MHDEKQKSETYKIKNGSSDYYFGLINALKAEGFAVADAGCRGKLKIMEIVNLAQAGEAVAEIISEERGFNKIARTLRIFDEKLYPVCSAFIYPIRSFGTKRKNVT